MGVDRGSEGVRGDLRHRDVSGAEPISQARREAEPQRAALAVDDDAHHAQPRQVRGCQLGAGQRVGSAGGAPVGDDDEERTQAWVAAALTRQYGCRLQEPLRQRRPAPRGQIVEAGRSRRR